MRGWRLRISHLVFSASSSLSSVGWCRALCHAVSVWCLGVYFKLSTVFGLEDRAVVNYSQTRDKHDLFLSISRSVFFPLLSSGGLLLTLFSWPMWTVAGPPRPALIHRYACISHMLWFQFILVPGHCKWVEDQNTFNTMFSVCVNGCLGHNKQTYHFSVVFASECVHVPNFIRDICYLIQFVGLSVDKSVG